MLHLDPDLAPSGSLMFEFSVGLCPLDKFLFGAYYDLCFHKNLWSPQVAFDIVDFSALLFHYHANFEEW